MLAYHVNTFAYCFWNRDLKSRVIGTVALLTVCRVIAQLTFRS